MRLYTENNMKKQKIMFIREVQKTILLFRIRNVVITFHVVFSVHGLLY